MLKKIDSIIRLPISDYRSPDPTDHTQSMPLPNGNQKSEIHNQILRNFILKNIIPWSDHMHPITSYQLTGSYTVDIVLFLKLPIAGGGIF